MTLEFTSRRRFIAGLTALVVTACSRTSDRDGLTDSTQVGETPSAPSTSSTADASSTTTTAPDTDSNDSARAVDDLEPPIVGLSTDPFALGVASGDPDADGVVLWVGLIGDGLPDVVPLLVEVSDTNDFSALVWNQIVEASALDHHTVRVLAEGLGPDRPLHYRFRVDGFTSPVGRTKTLGMSGRDAQIAVSSCQLLETGYFSAHRDIADSEVDLVVWLGDFIYEGGGASRFDGRAHDGGEAVDLAGYRRRYVQYLSEPDLQACRARHPWAATWDDHEVVNDYGAGVDPGRRLAAYRAWWEHIPTRLPAPTDRGLAVYRSVDLGAAGRVLLLDPRQYATGPTADKPTLLGEDQWAWLRGELSNKRGGWVMVASPTLVSGLTTSLSGAEPLLDYTFGAYPAERAELLELMAAHDAAVVSGDLHAGITLDAKPELFGPEATSAAPEFMAPAISSQFPERYAEAAPLIPLLNTQIRFIDITNGWLHVTVGDSVRADYRFVDDIADPGSGISIRASFQVDQGNPIPQRL